MSLFSPADRSSPPGRRSATRIPAGAHLYRAGAEGLAWRLHAGAMRPDTTGADGQDAFASLAIAGDILGIKGLERSGVLVPVRVEGVRAARSYAVDPAVLNGLPVA